MTENTHFCSVTRNWSQPLKIGINPLIRLIEELQWLHRDPTLFYNPGCHDASIPERWCLESLVRIRTVLRTEGSCWSFSILYVWRVPTVSFVQCNGLFWEVVDQLLSLIIVKLSLVSYIFFAFMVQLLTEASIIFPTQVLFQRATLIFCLRGADWFSICRSPNSEPQQTLEINNCGTTLNPQPGVTLTHPCEI